MCSRLLMVAAVRMINSGFKMIFATSYGYYNDMVKLAAAHPEVIFEHCGGPKAIPPNVGTYFSEVYQAVYLSGVTAGKMTKTGKLGFVSPFPFGVVNWFVTTPNVLGVSILVVGSAGTK